VCIFILFKYNDFQTYFAALALLRRAVIITLMGESVAVVLGLAVEVGPAQG
jgi:hypothetical protein